MIRLSKPLIDKRELVAIKEVLDTGWLAYGGGKTEELEEKVAKYIGTDHAVAVSSGTAGLHLVALAISNDSFIVPDFTFPASANAVLLAGKNLELVDIAEDFNIRLYRKYKEDAIMPVHEFGLPVDIDRLKEYIPKDSFILEDAACAFGASYHGKNVGTLGNAGVFSFHATKVLTMGEGGVVVTNDTQLADDVRMLRNHGKKDGQFIRVKGLNYRITELQAAIGIVQLDKIDKILEDRKKQALYYNSKLKDIRDIILPKEDEGRVWQRYVLIISPHLDRNKVIAKLRNDGIEAAGGTFCVSNEPAFRKYRRHNPIALLVGEQSLALPLYPRLKRKEQDYVMTKLREILQ